MHVSLTAPARLSSGYRRETPLMLLLLFVLTSFGCFNPGDVPPETTATINEPTTAVVPSMDEIQSGLSLTPEQSTRIEQLLQQWRQDEASQPGDSERRLSPEQRFLAASAPYLDTSQIITLIDILNRHRGRMDPGSGLGDIGSDPGGDFLGRPSDRHPPVDHQGRHSGGRGGFRGHNGNRSGGQGHPGVFRTLHRMLSQLDLTEEQKTALKEAFKAARMEARALHERLRNGEISREEFRTGRRTIQSELHAAIRAVLTDEQEAKLASLIKERLLRHLERRIVHGTQHNERALEFLTKVLQLDASQQTAIEQALTGGLETLIAIKDKLSNDELNNEETRAAFKELAQTTIAAIRAPLSEDQLAVFEALHRRHPRP